MWDQIVSIPDHCLYFYFRNKFATTNNLFVLKSLIDIILSSTRKLYCYFINFKYTFGNKVSEPPSLQVLLLKD